jgi:hypothetical protein
LNEPVPPKKKPRTPPPPTRRVQAPKQRTDKPAPGDLGLRQRTLLYGFAAAGFVGLIIVVVFAVFGGGSSVKDKNVAGLMKAAGCTFKSVKASVPGGVTHVASLTAKFPWNTNPPSNGQHYPLWAVWGFYTEAVNPRMVVHNEEHGGVIIWWGPKVPQSTVQKLNAFYSEQPTGTFGTPFANFGNRIAITAWTGNPATYQRNGDFGEGHIATCPSFTPATAKAFTAFRDAYRGHGPEGIPLSADAPGQGPPPQ